VRFETPPGHQAQVDFAECRFPWGKRFALLVVLGCSRLLWLRFYPRQTMATAIDGLEAAFAYFSGVPRELIRAITGHELDTIDQVLKCYAAVTADQAAAALNIRLAYEAEGRSA
jgi:hypothetical protein